MQRHICGCVLFYDVVSLYIRCKYTSLSLCLLKHCGLKFGFCLILRQHFMYYKLRMHLMLVKSFKFHPIKQKRKQKSVVDWLAFCIPGLEEGYQGLSTDLVPFVTLGLTFYLFFRRWWNCKLSKSEQFKSCVSKSSKLMSFAFI